MKSMANGYKYFCKINDTLPHNLKKNLEEMPNNKGYIYKDIRFYGAKPAEVGKPLVLFEKRGEILKIHEWSETEYCLYEKKGKNKK